MERAIASNPPSCVQWSAAVRTAVAAFLFSRALVFLLASVPALLQPAALDGEPSDRVVLAFDAASVSQQLWTLAQANDAGWYRGIMRDGYERRPFSDERQANWAFFPMLPMLWSGSAWLLGDSLVAALLVPNAMLLAGLVALYLLCLEVGRDHAVARRAAWLTAFAPCGHFFSFPWTESLFLCFSALCLWAAYRRIWWLLALAGVAASATRFPGLFLLPAAWLVCWQRGELHARSMLACLAIPCGTLAFAAHMQALTGNALAFVDIQAAWGRAPEVPVRALGIIVLRPWELAIDWNLRYLNLAVALLAAWGLRLLLRRREWGMALLLGLSLAAPLMTGTLTSLARYSIAWVPLAICIADSTGSPSRERVAWILSVSLMTAMTLAFGFGLNFAGA